MGFFERLGEARRAFFRAASPATSKPASIFALGDLITPPYDITPLGELERDNPSIHRIVKAISSDASSVKLILVRKARSVQQVEIIEDHPAINLFKHPNAIDPSYIFWETLYADLLVFGNHFSWLELDDSGIPISLLRIPANEMAIRPDNSGKSLIKEYVWRSPTGKERPYKPEEILHVKTRNLQDRYLGMSPLESLRASVLLERTMYKWNWNRFINAVAPNLILQSEQVMTGGESRKEQLRAYIKAKMSGPEHAGEPLILDGERWKVDVIQRQTEDEIAYLGGMKWIRATYAMNYGIPPSQMGDWSDSFRSNSKEQTADYVSEVLGTWHRLVLAFLNDIFLDRYWPNEPDLEFRYDYSAVPSLQPYRYQMAQIYEIMVRSAMVMPDEARQAMGFDESNEEAMKKFYWNGKELGEEPEPAPIPGMEEPEEEPEAPGAADEGGPADNKQKMLVKRAEIDDEFMMLSENDIIDIKDDKDRAKRFFRPLISFIILGAALNWLRLHNKKQNFSVRTPAFQDWVDAQTIRITDGVVDTTIERIRDVLRMANEKGLAVREVKRAIADVFETRKSNFELERIARTELHQASEGAGYLALLSDPIFTHKRWVTSRDHLVRGPQTGERRADHEDMDNQVVLKDQRFRDPVSNALLRFPGDADGAVSGADVCNCRCTFVAETEEFLDRDAGWLQRDNFVADSQKSLMRAISKYLDEMESRVMERLEALRRRKTA